MSGDTGGPAWLDDTDDESVFYDIMSRSQDDLREITRNVKRDNFDASNGPAVGLTSDGNVGLMLVLTPGTAVMVQEAWEAYGDHQCESARLALMGWLVPQMILLGLVTPALDDEVQAAQFFNHKHPEP